MDDGPGTDLGTAGWFLGIWVTMMAAMMLPSAAPMVLLYSRLAQESSRRSGLRTALFVTGYLLTWAAFGLGAYGAFRLVRALDPAFLAWDRGGPYVAGAAIALRGRVPVDAAEAGVPAAAAARRSAGSRTTGATARSGRSGWESSMAPGAWAAAGR